MTKGEENDFERKGGGEIIRVRNSFQAKTGKKIKFQTEIGKGRRKAKWNKTGESNP